MAKPPEVGSSRDVLMMELRRGVLALAALSRLKEEEYGYSLRKKLAASGLEVDEGTLYPLLRRLESQGYLNSRWQSEEGRPRKYYALSPHGEAALKSLSNDWQSLVEAMELILKSTEENESKLREDNHGAVQTVRA